MSLGIANTFVWLSQEARRVLILSREQIMKVLIRLWGCASWCVHSLFASSNIIFCDEGCRGWCGSALSAAIFREMALLSLASNKPNQSWNWLHYHETLVMTSHGTYSIKHLSAQPVEAFWLFLCLNCDVYDIISATEFSILFYPILPSSLYHSGRSRDMIQILLTGILSIESINQLSAHQKLFYCIL